MTKIDDLSDNRTPARQHQMMLALRRTGLGRYIKAELPEIELNSRFCQWRARDLRAELHQRSLEVLANDFPTRKLMAVTWVPADGVRSCPVAEDLLQRIAEAGSTLGVTRWTGVSEFDYDVTQRAWRETVHAVMSAPAGTHSKTFSKRLRGLLVRPDCRFPQIYRPVVVKPVTYLDGAISYVFKNLAILSTTQRVVWKGENGRLRPSKQRLRASQLRQLLKQAEHGPISRFAIETLDQVQS